MSVYDVIDVIMWKPHWEKKIYNENIIKRWKKECTLKLTSTAAFETSIFILKSMINRKIKEKLNFDDLNNFTTIKDNNIPIELKTNFINNVKKLEDLPCDYHPGSNDQVIDLVHPSLYCYLKGTTLFNNGSLEHPTINLNMMGTYHWLPSLFQINNNKTKIQSYINNLDATTYAELYLNIANIFDYFIDPFEKIIGMKLPENCQVITKLANIVLTPEKPDYKEGKWHIEGIPEENIIATGIYYYDIENITTSHLEFRRALQRPTNYRQDDDLGVKRMYGVQDEQILNQNIGKIETIQDRCIVFPNYIQHRVDSFSLLDKTKNGHRKILVFFLVNPKIKIISTEDIPPQHKYISIDQAKDNRIKLMELRKKFMNEINENVFEQEFSLCEH